MRNCIHCGKTLKPNGLNHQTYCKSNPNRKDMSGSNYPFYGRKGTNQYAKGVKMSDETRRKISEKSKNQVASNETKAKISESMKRAHLEGRAWNIGKSRWNNEPSYPEIFFIKVIENLDNKTQIIYRNERSFIDIFSKWVRNTLRNKTIQ